MDSFIPLDHRHVSHAGVSGHGAPQALDGVEGLPLLADQEAAVLDLMSRSGHCLTFGTIRSRTGLDTEELRSALDSLRTDGLVVRLHTVVESYACRFPGLDVDRG
jgi:RIO-like serine/threonine protein kinase